MLTDLDKQSGIAQRWLAELEAKRETLRVRCGRVMNNDPAVDALFTAVVRGQIKELTVLINEFTAEPKNASGAVDFEDESPRF